MSSRRLPGKVMAPIRDRPMVLHVLARAHLIGARTVLATSVDPSDDELAEVVARDGWAVHRGSRDDVLDRFLHAVPEDARFVVRITADCPLFDPRIGRTVLAAVREGTIDYASNIDPPTFPDGLDCEAFTADALKRAAREAVVPSEREHVTPFIRSHPELFRRWDLAHIPDLSAERWTVDHQRDLEFVRAVFEQLDLADERSTSMYTVLDVLSRRPGIRSLNGRTRQADG